MPSRNIRTKQERGEMMEEGKIYKQLGAIMADAKAIGKDSHNQKQDFYFRGIDAVMNHLHPIFALHGVTILPELLDEKSEERQTRNGGNLIYRILKIKFHFVADDGSEVCSTMIGEGMDSGDKAANKAMAVALKYALTQMLLLPYDEVDPDGDTPPPSSKKTLPAPAAPPPPKKTLPPPKKEKPTWAQVSNDMKDALGDDEFYKIVGNYGFEQATQVTDKNVQLKIYADMKQAVIDNATDKLKGTDNAKPE